jgi:hypothetical protein
MSVKYEVRRLSGKMENLIEQTLKIRPELNPKPLYFVTFSHCAMLVEKSRTIMKHIAPLKY